MSDLLSGGKSVNRGQAKNHRPMANQPPHDFWRASGNTPRLLDKRLYLYSLLLKSYYPNSGCDVESDHSQPFVGCIASLRSSAIVPIHLLSWVLLFCYALIDRIIDTNCFQSAMLALFRKSPWGCTWSLYNQPFSPLNTLFQPLVSTWIEVWNFC